MRANGDSDYDIPDKFKWQIGKTAASVVFVNRAEEYLAACQDGKKEALVRELIRKIKAHELVFFVFVDDFEGFLKTQGDFE